MSFMFLIYESAFFSLLIKAADRIRQRELQFVPVSPDAFTQKKIEKCPLLWFSEFYHLWNDPTFIPKM